MIAQEAPDLDLAGVHVPVGGPYRYGSVVVLEIRVRGERTQVDPSPYQRMPEVPVVRFVDVAEQHGV